MTRKAIAAIGILLVIVGALQVASNFIYVPRTIHAEIPTHRSEFIATEIFTIPAATNKTLNYTLNGGDNITFLLSVSSEKEELINFSVNNGSATCLSYPKTPGLWDFIWTVPSSTTYNFVYDNSFSSYSKHIHFQLMKEYTVMEPKDFTYAGRLVPQTYAYVGAITILIGTALAAYGFLRRSKTPSIGKS